jgi:hypothetical protein
MGLTGYNSSDNSSLFLKINVKFNFPNSCGFTFGFYFCFFCVYVCVCVCKLLCQTEERTRKGAVWGRMLREYFDLRHMEKGTPVTHVKWGKTKNTDGETQERIIFARSKVEGNRMSRPLFEKKVRIYERKPVASLWCHWRGVVNVDAWKMRGFSRKLM